MFGRRSASPCRCLAAVALGIMVLASLTTAQGEPAASPNQQLLAAAEHGNLTALQDAIAEGADVNGRGTNGLPPLLALFHSARGQLDADHRECITALLQAGAAVDALDGDRRTPLILAARLGDLQTVRLLVEAEAYVMTRDRFGKSALFYAVEAHRRDIVLYLATNGDLVSLSIKEKKAFARPNR